MHSRLPLLTALIAIAVAGFLAAPVMAETHIVDQVGLTFVPDELLISAGDTVEWRWSSGVHTVTEGTPCTPSGGFDEPLTSGNPIVTVTFNDAGVVDYFCIPHCGIGMTGQITVVGNVPALSPWAIGTLVLALMVIGGTLLRRRQPRIA